MTAPEPVSAAGAHRAVLEGAALVALHGLSQIEVGGGDARRFLAGQLTVDLRQPQPGRCALAAWCSAQGRVQALFGLLEREQGFTLLLPAPLVGNVLKRLRLFVLRADVTLIDVSATTARLGLTGPASGQALAATGLDAPAMPLSARLDADITLMRLHGPGPRFMLLGTPERVAQVREALAGQVTELGEDAWTLDRVLSAVPMVLPGTADRYLPQMLNLEPLGGLSYEKGCFPGQEVIARLHYRGELKRWTRLAAAEAPPPEPGTPVHAAQATAEPVGQVLLAAAHPDGGCRLLAVIAREAAAAPLALGEPGGPALRLLELPYPAPA